jgi:hypothetical protein
VEGLAGDGDGDLREPLLDRIGDPAVARPPVEVHVLDQVDPPDDRHRDLAVGGEDEVLLGQRVGAPHLGCLLADQRRVDGQLPLALEGGALDVDLPGQGHEPVQRAEVFLLEVEGLPGLGVRHPAVGVQDPQRVIGLLDRHVASRG